MTVTAFRYRSSWYRSSAAQHGVIVLDGRYNPGYTTSMKTAISIPDHIFEDAEQAAKRLGISRSELYSNAVRDYIEVHVSERVTETLDEIYSIQPSSLDSNVQKMQLGSLPMESW